MVYRRARTLVSYLISLSLSPRNRLHTIRTIEILLMGRSWVRTPPRAIPKRPTRQSPSPQLSPCLRTSRVTARGTCLVSRLLSLSPMHLDLALVPAFLVLSLPLRCCFSSSSSHSNPGKNRQKLSTHSRFDVLLVNAGLRAHRQEEGPVPRDRRNGCLPVKCCRCPLLPLSLSP